MNAKKLFAAAVAAALIACSAAHASTSPRSGGAVLAPLFLAAREGDAQKVEQLIAGGTDVNARLKHGVTALHCAILFPDGIEAARTLLDAGADVNAEDDEGRSPLMLALYKNRPAEFIRELLSRGAYPERHTDDGTTPMMLACQNSGDAALIAELYAMGAEAVLPRKDGEQPLHFAARNTTEAAPQIIAFLLENRAVVDCRDANGMTPLMTAAMCGNTTTIDALLERGAQIAATDKNGMTPLMFAAASPSPEAIAAAEKLAAAGADLTARDRFGRTAFLVAVRSGYSAEMLSWLSEAPERFPAPAAPTAEGAEGTDDNGTAQTDSVEEDGKDDDGTAREGETAEAPEISEDANADVHEESAPDEEAESTATEEEAAETAEETFTLPLTLAAVNPNAAPEIIAWLVAHGEDVEARDEDGRNAIICAVRYSTVAAPVCALIDAGADVGTKYKRSGLLRLLRFNDAMPKEEKRTVIAAIKKAMKDRAR